MRRLRKLHAEMRPNLMAAGIENVDAFFEVKPTPEQVEEYTAWLTGLEEYKKFIAIWGLRTAEWWANMTLLGNNDLREHKLLRVASKELRAAWRKRHPKKRSAQKVS